LGADIFLSKPINPPELVAQVKVLIRIKDAEDKLRSVKESIEKIAVQRKVTLRNTDALMRAMFDQSPIGIAMIDSLTGDVYEINRNFAAIAGRTVDEMHHLDLMKITHPDDVKENLENMSLMNAGKIPGFTMEKRYIRPDNSFVWINMTITPIKTEDLNQKIHLCMIENINERRKTKHAVRISEAGLQNKLKSILEPEDDISTLEFFDIIDIKSLKSMMGKFYCLTSMPLAVLDLSGKVLISIGWQDICTKFHRCHPDTLKNCIESDTILTHGVAEGEFKAFKCKNNMWDMVTPLIVGDRHIGNIFIGQFLYEDEKLNVDFFKEHARRYGFDETEYLAALELVPLFTRETVDCCMQFYLMLTNMISTMSLNAIRLSRMAYEEKMAEEKIKNLSRFPSENSSPVLRITNSGILMYINEAGSKLMRKHCNIDVGKNMSEFFSKLIIESVHTGRTTISEFNFDSQIFLFTINPIKNTSYVNVYGTDITKLKRSEQDLIKTGFNLDKAHKHALYMLAMASEYKDPETGEHIKRIVKITTELALEMGIKPDLSNYMGNDSILHDLGKLGIPDNILLKPGKLTVSEFETMKQHTEIGAKIIGNYKWFKQARQIALSHHERWDGKGYPEGLKGNTIPLAAKIVAVADVFDALISKRPYKMPWSLKKSIEKIKLESGKHFDPKVVEAFLSLHKKGILNKYTTK